MDDDPSNSSKSTRFQKGQSGNPKGRPKGRRSAVGIDRFLDEHIEVLSSDGKRRRITRLRALQEKSFQMAMNGNIAANKQLQKVGKVNTKAEIEEALVQQDEQRAKEAAAYGQEVTQKLERMAENKRLEREDQARRDRERRPIATPSIEGIE